MTAHQPTIPVEAGDVARVVAQFVLAVRAELADLPGDDVDDLTSGLEADLAEQVSESGVPGGPLTGTFGSARDYAAELRSAAGLPPRGAPAEPSRRRGIIGALRSSVADSRAATRARWAEFRDATPWAATAAAMAHELAPAWWVARGVGLGFVMAAVFGWALWVPFGITGVALSVWWARRSAGVRRGRWLGKLAALVAVVGLGIGMGHVQGEAQVEYVDSGGGQWLTTPGETVANIYVYDSDGHRLTGVRLFDQNGEPLVVSESQPYVAGNRADEYGGPADNVFPRPVAGSADPWSVPETDPSSGETLWSPPPQIVPLAPVPTPTGSPTSTPTLGSTPPPMGSTTSPTSAPSATSTAPVTPTSSRGSSRR